MDDSSSARPEFVSSGLLAPTLRAARLSVAAPAADGPAAVRVRVAWDGSWRNDHNWDAAWVFAKWRSAPGGAWQHARLARAAVAPGAAVAGEATVPADGMGAFVHRAVAGPSGPVAWDVRLEWAAGGPPSGAEVSVFAVEMVYVPGGPFWAGDGVSEGSFRHRDRPEPVRIDSTGSVLAAYYLDPTNLYMDGLMNQTGIFVDGDGGVNTGGADSRIDNSEFPSGYGSFYMMKYEVTQNEYASFLNLLTPAQAASRDMTREERYPIYRGSITSAGGVYTTEHPGRACSWMSWQDGAAWLDWSGLRPMTELEFEKAARGPVEPVAGEYAWGSRRIEKASRLIGPDGALATVEDGSEQVEGNAAYGVIAFVGGDGDGGALRVGIFSESAGGDRERAGASYYGVMELSGNLFERVVSVGHPVGRAFRGTHGDGVLTPDGQAANEDWPAADGIGAGKRGGNSGYSDVFLRISDRTYANYAPRDRVYSGGFRGVRTVQNAERP